MVIVYFLAYENETTYDFFNWYHTVGHKFCELLFLTEYS